MKHLPHTLAILFSAAAMTQAQAPNPSPAVPVEPIAAILDAFRSHAVVAISDDHGHQQSAAFRLALIRDPRFASAVNDIVVEFGNARLQNVADAFVSGETVPEAELQGVLREATVMFAWNAPMYRQFYETVREVNAKHLCAHPVRLVLGDPPFDWAKVETAADLKKVEDRDQFFAGVVEREVLAKKHRALMISGALHALRKYPKRAPGEDGFGEPSAAQLIEKKHPGTLFIVALVTTEAAAETMKMSPPPSFRVLHGSSIAKLNFGLIAPAWNATPVVVNGKHDWKLTDSNAWASMGEVVDGVLYLGGDETRVFPPASIYLEPAYQKELRRRIRIIKAYNGQDFEPILDDLIKEAEGAPAKS